MEEVKMRERERRRWRRGLRSNRHQYSSLVLRLQPRHMRANIREEVDQLKTHQHLPLSLRSPPSILLSLYSSPHLNPLPPQKRKSLTEAVDGTKGTSVTFPAFSVQPHGRPVMDIRLLLLKRLVWGVIMSGWIIDVVCSWVFMSLSGEVICRFVQILELG